MKILLVAMSSSIHTARLINQIADQGWDIHLFPSTANELLHPKIKNVTFYPLLHSGDADSSVAVHGHKVFFKILVKYFPRVLNKLRLYRKYKLNKLITLVKKINPTVVHALEFQSAGYLVSDAKAEMKSSFPIFFATNWGSDIFYYQRFPHHAHLIKKLLSSADYYSCECQRDVYLAQKHGFNGEAFPVVPNAGGFDLEFAQKYNGLPASKRKTLMLKGYQNWVGRALVAFDAFEEVIPLLRGYKINIYSASSSVVRRAKLFEKKYGIRCNIISNKVSHEDILKLHSQARISMGLSLSDGISTSMLEAILMGSFPIQSDTSGAIDWLESGRGGTLVPAEGKKEIVKALQVALTDDSLVDNAQKINAEVCRERLDCHKIKNVVVDFYKNIEKDLP